MDELTVEGDCPPKKTKEAVSPKVTRPKLPKFGSHTLGHHYRHKTDPGQPQAIKSFLEEVKQWKDGSIFDKANIKPTVIKPRTIPKAHSTHTSPKGSPPPGSPNTLGRCSSLNRNRSKSLKLLTDKLKSGRGGQTSPKQVPKIRKETDHSESPRTERKSNNLEIDSAQFPNNVNESKGEFKEYDKHDKVDITEAIPEKDEKEIDDDRDDVSPERGLHKTELKFKLKDSVGSSPRLSEDEGIDDNDNESAAGSGIAVAHPIDRNSEFLRLRQMAPPQRRVGYAGLALPKKLPNLYKADDKSEEGAVRKSNKLELGGYGNARKLSGTRFSTHPPQSKTTFLEDGAMDTNGFGSFRSPSFETPPPFPGELREVHSDGSLTDSQLGTDDGSEIGTTFPDVVQTIADEGGNSAEMEKLEKRNGKCKSPKQKSKSDPSGNKTFDFENVPGVINSSQSQSFPLLGKKQLTKSESLDHDLKEIQADQERRNSENVIHVGMTDSDSVSASVSASDHSKSYGTSVSEDLLFSPQSEYSDAFEDPMSQSLESEEFQNKAEVKEPIHEDAVEHDESLDDSTCSLDSTTTPMTAHSHSLSGDIERTQNLLSVPTPKRPISRSVSSASVLSRENRNRKYSGGSLKDKSESVIRKHSITSADESTINEKPMDFLPIGDSGNSLAVSMPSVWRADRLASESPDRDVPFRKVCICRDVHILNNVHVSMFSPQSCVAGLLRPKKKMCVSAKI